ncbi:hypothetical protein Adt_17566 [Abeliophyllum distichum]|uniref:Uncharacterized protein n=1 Tax=Abeliophyllum distichum TaxID=126358 RepID=A0ABD1TGU2_9LAMI
MSYNSQFSSVTASLHLLDKSLPIGELQIFTGKSFGEVQISTGESSTNSKYRPNPNTHHRHNLRRRCFNYLTCFCLRRCSTAPVISLKISEVNLTITIFDDGCGG